MKDKMNTQTELDLLLDDRILMPKIYNHGEVQKLVKAAYERALDDHKVLHGERAEKLLQEIMNPEPITEGQKEMIKLCEQAQRKKKTGGKHE